MVLSKNVMAYNADFVSTVSKLCQRTILSANVFASANERFCQRMFVLMNVFASECFVHHTFWVTHVLGDTRFG